MIQPKRSVELGRCKLDKRCALSTCSSPKPLDSGAMAGLGQTEPAASDSTKGQSRFTKRTIVPLSLAGFAIAGQEKVAPP